MALKLAVVGNCQALGVAQCLSLLLPRAEVTGVSWATIISPQHAEPVAKALESCDLVLSQVTHQDRYGALRADALSGRLERLFYFPRIAFTGFHPDLIGMAAVKSPLGGAHSALILAGHGLGLPGERIAELFNAYVYARLGYFEEYAKAEAYLIESVRQTELELTEDMADWGRQGAFVHTPTHPAIRVLRSMARALCVRTGLDIEGAGEPPDALLESVIWPVYPEIAKRLGVAGSLAFNPPGAEAAPIDLHRMIDGSLRVYARSDPQSICPPRIAEMMDILKRECV